MERPSKEVVYLTKQYRIEKIQNQKASPKLSRPMLNKYLDQKGQGMTSTAVLLFKYD